MSSKKWSCYFATTTGCDCPGDLLGVKAKSTSKKSKRQRDRRMRETCCARKTIVAGDFQGSEICGAVFHKVCREAFHPVPSWCGCGQDVIPRPEDSAQTDDRAQHPAGVASPRGKHPREGDRGEGGTALTYGADTWHTLTAAEQSTAAGLRYTCTSDFP
jgi:hypothetical protein